jgi:hypothetical protein
VRESENGEVLRLRGVEGEGGSLCGEEGEMSEVERRRGGERTDTLAELEELGFDVHGESAGEVE